LFFGWLDAIFYRGQKILRIKLHLFNSNKSLSLLLINFLVLGAFIGLIQIPTAKAATTFGNTSIGGSYGNAPAGFIIGNKFQFPTDGDKITSGFFHFDGTLSNNYKFAVYEDAGSKNLVVESAAVNSGTGWVEFNLADTTLVPDAYYWLVLLSEGTISIEYSSTGDAGWLERPYASGFPATLAGWTTENKLYSVYATYSVYSEPSAPLTGNPNFDFTLVSNATAYYIINKTGSFIYDSASPNTAFTALGTYANNSKSSYVNCSLVGASSFSADNLRDVYFSMDSSVNMTINDAVDQSVLVANNAFNVTFYKFNIDGNADGQTTAWVTNGIFLWNCGNCLVLNSTITNVYRDGYQSGDDVAGNSPNGIINSTITFCGWNGMSLGAGGSNTHEAYAINNTIAYCSDVGITNLGYSNLIQGNYIHDMNGTTNTQAHWGIGIEAGAYHTIVNNRLENLGSGVSIAPQYTNTLPSNSNYIAYNTFLNCNGSISNSGWGYDVITHNTITNWGIGASWAVFGIKLDSNAYVVNTNNIVSFNTFISDSVDSDLGNPIYHYNSTNNAIYNNTITVPLAANGNGIMIQTTSNGTIVQGNNIQAKTGIYITSGCNLNKLNQNTLGNCTTGYTDLGTGTIINPISSPTYTLTLNNIFDGSAQGVYSYSNTTQKILTTSGVLNVDGTNVTSPYTMTMNTDHFAYVLDGSASIGSSPIDATPAPTRTKAQLATDQVFTNMYIALGLIGAGLIIISAFIMLKSMGGDFNDSNGSLVGVGLLITTLIGLVLGFVIINAFQNSTISITLLFWHG
jgi:hypothetical protein